MIAKNKSGNTFDTERDVVDKQHKNNSINNNVKYLQIPEDNHNPKEHRPYRIHD